jgi:nucleoid-associated protein
MLTRLIAHQVLKSGGSTEADSKQRADLLPETTELAQTFFGQVRDSFRNRNPAAGIFQRTAEGVIPEFEQLLRGYLGERSDATFVKFSHDALGLLCSKIKRQPAAIGGYLVFAEFSANDAEFLLVALLNVSAKPNFDENMNLIATAAPDLDHLRHGVRARLDRVANNDDGVLQFLSSSRAGVVSQYFTDFIGCKELVKPAQQAAHLHHALERWKEEKGLTDEESSDLMSKTYNHVKACRDGNQPLTLTGLANALIPNDPTPLATFLAGEAFGLAGESAPPPPSAMKRFIRFAYKDEGLTLEFDRSKWMGHIEPDAATRTVTIRNAPDSLLAQLNEP